MAANAVTGPARAALDTLSTEQISFLQSLPKAELHAHLNGCIPIATLEELANEYIESTDPSLEAELSRDMLNTIQKFKDGHKLEKITDFFSLFPTIYTLTSTPDALRRATRAVLELFLGGGNPQAHYLELRTGPRKTQWMTREDYMCAVLDEVERYDEDAAGLILTLDRTTGAESWKETLDVALKLKKAGRRLLGVDLAGNPLNADVGVFEQFFADAKNAGLGVTLHIAEVRDRRSHIESGYPRANIVHQTNQNTPEETLKLLSYRPDRLGHATFLNEEAVQIVMKDDTPIEICLTSNLLSVEFNPLAFWNRAEANHSCSTVSDLESHHIQQYLKANHPIAICVSFLHFGSWAICLQHALTHAQTDDTLPFRTNLIAEYSLLLAKAPYGLGLSEKDVQKVAEMSMRSRFKELLARNTNV